MMTFRDKKETVLGGLAAAAALAAGSEAYATIQSFAMPADIAGTSNPTGSVAFTSRGVDFDGDATNDGVFGYQETPGGNGFSGFGLSPPAQPVGYVIAPYAY